MKSVIKFFSKLIVVLVLALGLVVFVDAVTGNSQKASRNIVLADSDEPEDPGEEPDDPDNPEEEDTGDYGIIPTGEDEGLVNPSGFSTIQNVVFAVINVAYSAAAIVAVIFLIIGGYKYVTSGGNPDAAEEAKGAITNAIVGLIIILISYLIIAFILEAIGAGGLMPEIGPDSGTRDPRQ